MYSVCIVIWNAEKNLIFRIRLNKVLNKKSKSNYIDPQDEIYMLKSFKEELLHNIVIRGVKDIKKVNLRKINQNLNYNYETQNFEKHEINVLDTIGTNLLDILSISSIDPTRTYSNNIMEMKDILGIDSSSMSIPGNH